MTTKVVNKEEEEDPDAQNLDHDGMPIPLIKKTGLSDKEIAEEYYKKFLNENKRISTKDFMLFENKKGKERVNAENQRLLGSFNVEKLAIFFIKFRVDRNAVNDPTKTERGLNYVWYIFLFLDSFLLSFKFDEFIGEFKFLTIDI